MDSTSEVPSTTTHSIRGAAPAKRPLGLAIPGAVKKRHIPAPSGTNPFDLTSLRAALPQANYQNPFVAIPEGKEPPVVNGAGSDEDVFPLEQDETLNGSTHTSYHGRQVTHHKKKKRRRSDDRSVIYESTSSSSATHSGELERRKSSANLSAKVMKEISSMVDLDLSSSDEKKTPLGATPLLPGTIPPGTIMVESIGGPIHIPRTGKRGAVLPVVRKSSAIISPAQNGDEPKKRRKYKTIDGTSVPTSTSTAPSVLKSYSGGALESSLSRKLTPPKPGENRRDSLITALAAASTAPAPSSSIHQRPSSSRESSPRDGFLPGSSLSPSNSLSPREDGSSPEEETRTHRSYSLSGSWTPTPSPTTPPSHFAATASPRKSGEFNPLDIGMAVDELDQKKRGLRKRRPSFVQDPTTTTEFHNILERATAAQRAIVNPKLEALKKKLDGKLQDLRRAKSEKLQSAYKTLYKFFSKPEHRMHEGFLITSMTHMVSEFRSKWATEDDLRKVKGLFSYFLDEDRKNPPRDFSEAFRRDTPPLMMYICLIIQECPARLGDYCFGKMMLEILDQEKPTDDEIKLINGEAENILKGRQTNSKQQADQKNGELELLRKQKRRYFTGLAIKFLQRLDVKLQGSEIKNPLFLYVQDAMVQRFFEIKQAAKKEFDEKKKAAVSLSVQDSSPRDEKPDFAMSVESFFLEFFVYRSTSYDLAKCAEGLLQSPDPKLQFFAMQIMPLLSAARRLVNKPQTIETYSKEVQTVLKFLALNLQNISAAEKANSSGV